MNPASYVGLILYCIGWLNTYGPEHLVYDPARGLPAVEWIDADTALHEIYPIHDAAHAEDMKKNLVAYYKHDAKTIMLVTGNYKGDVGPLIHEAVHFVQYQNGLDREVRCLNELERDAYRLQADYEKSMGLELSVNPLWGYLKSECPERSVY